MKKLFERHEILFCLVLIVIYILVNSYCMQNFGIEDYKSTIVNTIFSIALIVLMITLKRISYYGLTKVTNLSTNATPSPSLLSLIIFASYISSRLLMHILSMQEQK